MKSHTPELSKQRTKIAAPNLAIVGLIAASIAFVLELTLTPLLLPAIQIEFGLSIEDLSWVFNSYGIAVAVGVLLGGWSGDALNTRKVFCFGLATFAGGAFLVAFANSFETLILGRVLQGFGGGIFSPLTPLLITRVYPLKPGRALIFLGSIAGYIAAFAPFVYANAFRGYGWEVALILNATIAVVALAAMVATPETSKAEASASGRKDYSAFFRSRDLWLTYVYVFCTYGAITYFLFFLPVWLTGNDVTTASIGFLLSILWLTFSLVSTVLRGLVDGPHVKTIKIAAPLLIAAGVPVLSYDQSMPTLVLASVLVGSGLACSNAPSTQLILKFAPKGMSAVATSLDITFARLGGILAVAMLAEMAPVQAATIVCLFCAVAACCTFVVGKKLSGLD